MSDCTHLSPLLVEASPLEAPIPQAGQARPLEGRLPSTPFLPGCKNFPQITGWGGAYFLLMLNLELTQAKSRKEKLQTRIQLGFPTGFGHLQVGKEHPGIHRLT